MQCFLGDRGSYRPQNHQCEQHWILRNVKTDEDTVIALNVWGARITEDRLNYILIIYLFCNQNGKRPPN